MARIMDRHFPAVFPDVRPLEGFQDRAEVRRWIFPAMRESIDHFPAPTMSRNTDPRIMHRSVLPSWDMDQNPFFIKIGIFVVVIATIMFMTSGMAASLVKRPITTRRPHDISTTPTKGAVISGNGIPILMNLPTPSVSEYMNFWTPSDQKTHPIMNRTSRFARDIFDEKIEFNKSISFIKNLHRIVWCSNSLIFKLAG